MKEYTKLAVSDLYFRLSIIGIYIDVNRLIENIRV